MKLILKIRGHLNSLLWNLRRALPDKLQPILFSPPEGTIETEEYCRQNSLPFEQIRGKLEIERALPDTPENEVHWRFRKKRYYTYPETWVAQVPDACVVGRFGHVLTQDRILLTDASYHLGSQDPLKHTLFTEYVTIPKKKELSGLSTLLTGPSSRGYFHWLTDSLPRLYLIREAGFSLNDIDHFIIPQGALPAIRETLDLLGIQPEKRVEANPRSNIYTEKLILPSMPGRSGNPAPEVREYLRGHFLNPVENRPGLFPKRIYISRKGTRRILNENELLPVLQKHNIEPVFPERMSFAEQVALFSRAELILAPHGAALTNLIFSAPGTTVIELFSPNYLNLCYWSICNQGNLRYSYILGEGERPPNYKDPHQVRDDIKAPVAIIDEWIDSWV